MNLKNRLAGIDTSLDDLQSGVDAGSRETGHIQKTAASIDQLQLKSLENPDLVGILIRHVNELQACVRDQRAALREIRNAVARLRDELTGSDATVRPPLANAADRPRR